MSEIHLGAKKRCVLDGELFVMRDAARMVIQPWIVLAKKQRIEDAARRAPATYVPFDILYCGDKMVITLPLIDRKNLLSAVINDTARLAESRFVLEKGVDLFNLTKAEGLEGMVASNRQLIPVRALPTG